MISKENLEFSDTSAEVQGPLEEQFWLYNGGSGGFPLPTRAPKPKSPSQGSEKRAKLRFFKIAIDFYWNKLWS